MLAKTWQDMAWLILDMRRQPKPRRNSLVTLALKTGTSSSDQVGSCGFAHAEHEALRKARNVQLVAGENERAPGSGPSEPVGCLLGSRKHRGCIDIRVPAVLIKAQREGIVRRCSAGRS